MASSSLRFALNHMIYPRFSIEELMQAAIALDIDAIELRNDVGDNSLTSLDQACTVGARAKELGLTVLSLNALYPFNVWNAERADQAERLAALTAAAGGQGLVLCPLVDSDGSGAPTDMRKALVALDGILGRQGLKGFVEPLGFPFSTLRFKREAIAVIDELGLGERFSLVHDTFHHQGAGETELYPQRTGLVHVSGIEDPGLDFAAMLDGDRLLVGEADRLDNAGQLIQLLQGGYHGHVSFEPFADSVHAADDPIAALKDSIAFLREHVGA
ncbi:TIM barrel protein [Halomonas binhaiensis]|uniref:TIM barrel protein n=1 Tax=Halomonas binhaiensis TaxID=2562282 RepID=A0A5C1NJM7_9GAMM|nr:TIM barrel protein [Halomonas binhaiensis]QEM83486.1 TIM barrel protein [Halomonas binhaiensis]